ncbi:DUF262 domain-containing protein [Salinicola endophyticus]|uniref:DUF262 domain-containing protein n=1 Tax=Salinicola endophyticus TaxID=1949083 RepID=UPI001CB75C56|nr:DUF262 domain-containing protein [Salinicola endophyticus]
MSGLVQQIDEKSKEIATDSYPMSIGELVNLYRDNEINVHPEFQRFFRWSNHQKSRFIESLLLGIPIPSIFVAEKEDGTWEVVDGLQRFSTILEFMGILKTPKGEIREPLVLEGTKYLPLLDNMCWDSNLADGAFQLPKPAQLKIKRSKLDLKIVLKASDPASKYELFQRLNTGGSLATDQEVRNCILIMINPDFFEWVSDMAGRQEFQDCLPLSERQRQEQYDSELLIRFLALAEEKIENLKKISELGVYLTDVVVNMAEDDDLDRSRIELAFVETFSALSRVLGEEAFKKFDPSKERSLGAPLISVFECMALGLGNYYLRYGRMPSDVKIKEVHEKLWVNEKFKRAASSGVRASSRIPVTVEVGRELFE